MERSQNKEHLDPYSILADYYDALLGDKDGFKIWIDALKKYTKDCDFIVNLAGVNRPKDAKEFYEGK